MADATMERFVAQLREGDSYVGPLTGLPYAEFMGFEVRRTGDDVCAVMPYKPMLIGSPKRLHGGTTGALLETAGIIQLLWQTQDMPVGVPKPISLTVDYLRGGAPADVFARAHVVRLGRRVANVRAEAWQGDADRLIAQAHIHFLIPS